MRQAAVVILATAACSSAAGAQQRNPTDRSLAASLMAVSMPSPVGPAWTIGDSAKAAGSARFDLTFGQAVRGSFGTRHGTAVIGLRMEGIERDSAGTGASAGYVGARVGFRAGDAATTNQISAIELYAGGRTHALSERAVRPDVGLDFVAGWGGFGGNTRASLGVRVPVEVAWRTGGARLSLFAAPTMSWGYIRIRSCEDTGPGDNCGDLNLQVAFGQTRYILSGGVSAGAERLGLGVSAGVQRLVAPGEAARFWIGTSWNP
jgi:hypothetical protein